MDLLKSNFNAYVQDINEPYAFFIYPKLAKSFSINNAVILNDVLLPAPIAIVFGNGSTLAKSWSTDLAQRHPSGAWRTIHGVHVFLDPISGSDAKILAGPQSWIGKHPDEIETKSS